MDIVRFALRFPYTFFTLAALILFLGISAIVVMPTDIFPQINIPVVSVIWQYTGLSTPEMEQRAHKLTNGVLLGGLFDETSPRRFTCCFTCQS